MNKIILPLFLFIPFLWELTNNSLYINSHSSIAQPLINSEGKTVLERVKVPENFRRVSYGENSFANYLRDLPLKKDGSKVRFYDGGVKPADVHIAVIDMEIGTKNLQQCADACIRLRSEYLYSQKKFENIHFNFTNGFNAEYEKWRNGYRIVVEGNNCYWKKSYGPDSSYSSFRKYLDRVFSYAGTLSLSKEMVNIALKELEPGDVFIQGGSPGHAVIVLDVAENIETGEKVFLLAQSYMPAQEIHILVNPNDNNLNPWYSLNVASNLITPEWVFPNGSLKRFRN